MELGIPSDYASICTCPEATVNAALKRLTNCGNELPGFYRDLGRNELRTLRSKLHFAAALLVDQAAAVKRDVCEQLRRLHDENPSFPSLATIYRCVAPLKVWLQRRCEGRHAFTLKDLQADKRPLLLLNNENIESILNECKSFRKFAKTYRPRRKSKTPDPSSSAIILFARADIPKDSQTSETVLLIRGKISAEAQEAIVKTANQNAEIVVLRGPTAKKANQLLHQALKPQTDAE